MKRILLAEDEPQIAKLVIFKLSKEGYEITWAENGLKALNYIEQEKFDLIMLDVMMPELDGYQVLAQKRSYPLNAETPVVMLTAKGQESDMREGYKLGVVDYIVKPFLPQELVERLKKLEKAGSETC